MFSICRRTGIDSQDVCIQRYAVIPLSPTAGLISWVPNCDTLHDLIRGYRDSRKIMLDVENKLILQVAPNKLYDQLPAIHKVEVGNNPYTMLRVLLILTFVSHRFSSMRCDLLQEKTWLKSCG